MKIAKVASVGINDADYPVRGTMCPLYTTWKSMMERCYTNTAHKYRPSYQDCYVVNEWHYFSNFRNWAISQDYLNKHLDKDLLVKGNKVYGPDTCIFVSNEVNNLLNKHDKRRGKYPIGVSWDKHRQKYLVSICTDGKRKSLGRFDSLEQASAIYREHKAAHVKKVALNQTCTKTKEALLRISEEILKDAFYD